MLCARSRALLGHTSPEVPLVSWAPPLPAPLLLVPFPRVPLLRALWASSLLARLLPVPLASSLLAPLPRVPLPPALLASPRQAPWLLAPLLLEPLASSLLAPWHLAPW